MAFEAVRTAKQTVLNRAGEQQIADQFHQAYASLCDFAQQRLNVDFIDPDDYLVKDEKGQLRPISSKLDAVAAELFPDRAKINSKFNEKLGPLTKDIDAQGDQQMRGKSKINMADVVKFMAVCHMLENHSLACEGDLAKKRIRELKFEQNGTGRLWHELRMLTWISTGQCQTDQFIYDELVKLLPEALTKHLSLFHSTAIRPGGIVNIKTLTDFVDDYVRVYGVQPTARVAAVAAERAATVVDDDLEECSSAILNALRQARGGRPSGNKNAESLTDRSFAGELVSLVAKHKLL
jgi:hypothetical protein